MRAGGNRDQFDSVSASAGRALRRASLFSRARERDFEALTHAAMRQACDGNEVVGPLKGAGNTLFVVETGVVRELLISPDGRELDVAYRQAGEAFVVGRASAQGEFARVAQTTGEGAQLWALAWDRALDVVTSHPPLARDFIVWERHEWRQQDRATGEQAFCTARKRLAHRLLGKSWEDAEGAARGTHQEFAHSVGTTRPRISAEVSEFRKEGLVDYRSGDPEHRIFVLDRRGLSQAR